MNELSDLATAAARSGMSKRTRTASNNGNGNGPVVNGFLFSLGMFPVLFMLGMLLWWVQATLYERRAAQALDTLREASERFVTSLEGSKANRSK